MNKTVSINLGGIFFHIEEQAYQQLEQYLNRIQQYFAADNNAQEMLEDIEARIAEMFQEQLQKEKRPVVLSTDVRAMIHLMGMPEQIAEPLLDNTQSTSSQNRNEQLEEDAATDAGLHIPKRRLYRNVDDKVVAGVASGLAAYFGIDDPVWIRLGFALSTLLGISPIIYPILWAIVPPAKTPAQKLAMRGKPINLANIEEGFKEEFSTIKKNINSLNTQDARNQITAFFQQLLQVADEALQRISPYFARILRLLALILGISILVSLIGAVVGLLGFVFNVLRLLFDFVFSYKLPVIIALASLASLLLIPIIGLTYWLLNQTMGVRIPYPKQWRAALGGLWLAGLFFLFGSSASIYSNNFSSQTHIDKFADLTTPTANAIIIEGNTSAEVQMSSRQNDKKFRFNRTNFFFDSDKKTITAEGVRLNIIKSDDDQMHLEQHLSASGSTAAEAQEALQNIRYNFSQNDSVLVFPTHFDFDSKWRNQHLELTLQVPVGKTIFLAPSSGEVIYDIQNQQDMLDSKMLGKWWLMTPTGLSLVDNNDNINTKANLPLTTKFDEFDERVFEVSPDDNVREIQLPEFNMIHLSGNTIIDIQQGSNYSVKVLGNKETVEAIELVVDDEEMQVKYNPNHSNLAKIQITMPSLTSLNLSGVSQARISGFEQEDEKIELQLSGSSRCHAQLDAEDLAIEMSGSTLIWLNGTIENVEANISGASSLDATQSTWQNAAINVSGACLAKVNVTQQLDCSATGSSQVWYKGKPTEVTTKILDAASIQAE